MIDAQKKQAIDRIYSLYESETGPYLKEAACKKGCAFCCTEVGNVDITTLEGLIISDFINTLPGKEQRSLKTALKKNKREKEKQNIARCPFLSKDDACKIYPVRPFSCRKLYSVTTCTPAGPTLHRSAAQIAETCVKRLQQLDDTGYSGHISFILYLLEQPAFKSVYKSGEFNPDAIIDFGKSHQIQINRMAGMKPSGTSLIS